MKSSVIIQKCVVLEVQDKNCWRNVSLWEYVGKFPSEKLTPSCPCSFLAYWVICRPLVHCSTRWCSKASIKCSKVTKLRSLRSELYSLRWSPPAWQSALLAQSLNVRWHFFNRDHWLFLHCWIYIRLARPLRSGWNSLSRIARVSSHKSQCPLQWQLGNASFGSCGCTQSNGYINSEEPTLFKILYQI